MALLNFLLSPYSLLLTTAAVTVYYLYPYFVTYGSLRSIPAPFPAQFTNLWLLSVCRRGKRYKMVDEVHKRLGPIVRIQPNHMSVNDDEAIYVIYGHGNGMLKS
jgi:benzoate 4-monooxygenase